MGDLLEVHTVPVARGPQRVSYAAHVSLRFRRFWRVRTVFASSSRDMLVLLLVKELAGLVASFSSVEEPPSLRQGSIVVQRAGDLDGTNPE